MRRRRDGHWGMAATMAAIRRWDATEAEALYEILEKQVVPEFYTRDGNGIPVVWVGASGKAWPG